MVSLLKDQDIINTHYEVQKIIEEPSIAYGAEITSLDQLDLKKLYSYADYFKWKFQERVELIGGLIHEMSPAPSPTHSFLLPVSVFKISPPVKAPYNVEGIGFDVSGHAPLSQPM